MKKILLFALISLLVSFKHPFYLSVTNLKYNVKDKALQGSVKLFTNDLEDALKRTEHRTVDLIHPEDTLKTQQLLEGYLKKRLSLSLNNEQKNFQVLGFEREQEAIWIYIEFKGCNLPETIRLENSLLYDFIENQSNIMHFEVKGERKSYKLNNPDRLAVFNF